MSQNDLKTLGLGEAFTLAELKAAYRNRALAVHPDKGGTNEQFIELNKAYKRLIKLAGKVSAVRRVVAFNSAEQRIHYDDGTSETIAQMKARGAVYDDRTGTVKGFEKIMEEMIVESMRYSVSADWFGIRWRK